MNQEYTKITSENWDHVRIKNVEEVKPRRINTDTHIQIPSNLTKAEAEKALKKASEDKVEVDRWYLVKDEVSSLQSAMYLNEFKGDKGWEEHKDNGIVIDFNDLTIISPMYTQEELNKSKGE